MAEPPGRPASRRSARGRAPPRRWPGRAGSRDDGLLREAVLAGSSATVRPTSSSTGRSLKAAIVSLTRTKRRSRSTNARPTGAVEKTVSSRLSDRSAASCRRALSIASAQRCGERLRRTPGRTPRSGAPRGSRAASSTPAPARAPPAARSCTTWAPAARPARARRRSMLSSMAGADVGGQDRLAGLRHAARLRRLGGLAPPAADLQQHRLERGVVVAAGELALPVAGVRRAGPRTSRRCRARPGAPPRAASSRSPASARAARWRWRRTRAPARG